VVCALIEDDGKVLIARRSIRQALPLKWEFPGGKIEPGESKAEALSREIREELGVDIAVGAALPAVTHAYPDFTIVLHPRICRLVSGTPVPHEHAEIVWCPPDRLGTLDWAEADLPVLRYYLDVRRTGS